MPGGIAPFVLLLVEGPKASCVVPKLGSENAEIILLNEGSDHGPVRELHNLLPGFLDRPTNSLTVNHLLFF
jgi:hypothetical protein